MTETIDTLTSRFPRPGRIAWIGLRPERRSSVIAVEAAAILETGLEGDHRNKAGKRAITLIQAEHLAAIASLCGVEQLDPAPLRRNIVVTGINLLALRNRRFRCGGAVLRGTGICAPCSRMEEALGPGGYNAMRGHGGINAEVMESGLIKLKDLVEPVAEH
ncbi:MOSC domain-containing protein [Oricola cellulosilytica]|uniref:MOSC domain-containing protein n=1 Tax=Oricola cellulosilytica TaxID=1429082 RepID=A0A4R0PG00_9HYPH|nr:MOSC domain-containing protein [Oricola cellulosilytica]TCD15345.1 MOSC domain-containing protein [Oricola cellulosilytica]